MSIKHRTSVLAVSQHASRRTCLLIGGLTLITLFAVISVIGSRTIGMASGGAVLVLALPAFLAGMLSFVSPCCLPVLSAYFAFSMQTRRERMLRMSIAFFLGLATTLIVLGASATALSQLLFRNLDILTQIGGVLITGFGLMSMLGKGFGGIQLLDRPSSSTVGAYVYGATFALGWTACVGPILGALLTLLATQGIAVLEGAVLAFIYALGLGTPLFLLATWCGGIDQRSRLWRIMRGRGFSINLGFTTIHTHTTSLLSGLLLITVGVLLASGQLAALSRWSLQTPLTQWVLGVEDAIQQILLGR